LRPNQPVVGVSFFEAEAYCRFAGRRLPSEEEWERAARGDAGLRYPWGEAFEPERALHRATGYRHTLPVGCFPGGVSPYGLFDAAGNVWEWVRGTLRSPSAATPLHVARGGAWNALPPQLRCANRNAWPAAARYSNIGFRSARE
jgi:formylglycine-generating enzyme required for sulfatase activity